MLLSNSPEDKPTDHSEVAVASEKRESGLNVVYLYLKDVRNGLLGRSDWLFTNDRIIVTHTEGMGIRVKKQVLEKFSKELGENEAKELIKRVRALRRKGGGDISNGDIQNLLKVDSKNSEVLYSEIISLQLERKFFGAYQMTVSYGDYKRKAKIPWSRAKFGRLKLFFKARLGTKLISVS